jgi:hypothetical protein
MLDELVRCHARQQHSANPKVCRGALAFWDERISRLLNTALRLLRLTLNTFVPAGYPFCLGRPRCGTAFA